MPTIKPYRAADRDARKDDIITMDSHGIFTVETPGTNTESTSIYNDSNESSSTDARALRAATRARSRSPLRSVRRKTCAKHATPDVLPLRMAQHTQRNEMKQHKLKLMEMKMDLLRVLTSAVESGCVVLVCSSEKSDWKAYEHTVITTVAPNTTRWAALGKLVTFICAYLSGRDCLSSSPSLCPSTSKTV
jgi:hypothetical protein